MFHIKSILPQLKDAQCTDKNPSEISVTEHHNEEKILDKKFDETVDFKALTQAFGQVNLRAIPKHNSQNRHFDYYFNAKQNGNDFADNKFMKRQTNIIAGEINRPPIKRYTSAIVITDVTLKSNNAPKSMSTCKDPRDQLLESIRNY
ncbi:hypothetical protein PV327_011106, partial [Microctonus hyperodae]